MTDEELLHEAKAVADAHSDYLRSSLSRRGGGDVIVRFNSGAIYLKDGRVIRFDNDNNPYFAGH